MAVNTLVIEMVPGAADHAGMGNRIRELREDRGWTLAELANRVGTSPQQIYKLERGERKLTVDWLTRLRDALGVPDIADLVAPRASERASAASGLAPTSTVVELPHGLEPIPVIGVVQAGHWVEAVELPEEEWQWIAIPVDPRLRGMRRFGLRVAGRSMDLVYSEGTILICIKLLDLGFEPQPGQRVICLRRNSAGLTEATVKELVVENGRRLLMPRSSVPAYQTPVELHDPGDEDDNEDVRLMAIVAGSYKPEL